MVLMIGVFTSGLLNLVKAEGGPVKGYSSGSIRASAPAKALGVDQFMTQVSLYPGPVLIEGVVSGVFPKHCMVALIDANEFKACGVTTCAKLTLPVQWTGRMPKIKDTVRVTGQVMRVQQKMVFVAKRLTAVGAKR